MYKLEFLPIAKKDIDNIIYYISNKLQNPTASSKLAIKLIKGANSILTFPYGAAIYKTKNELKYEYRSIKINNFLMFYTIDEDSKIVTIVRVIYEKMNINNILEWE